MILKIKYKKVLYDTKFYKFNSLIKYNNKIILRKKKKKKKYK